MRQMYFFDPLGANKAMNAKTWTLIQFEMEFNPSTRMIEKLNRKHEYDGISFQKHGQRVVVAIANCSQEKVDQIAQELNELEKRVLQALEVQELTSYAQEEAE